MRPKHIPPKQMTLEEGIKARTDLDKVNKIISSPEKVKEANNDINSPYSLVKKALSLFMAHEFLRRHFVTTSLVALLLSFFKRHESSEDLGVTVMPADNPEDISLFEQLMNWIKEVCKEITDWLGNAFEPIKATWDNLQNSHIELDAAEKEEAQLKQSFANETKQILSEHDINNISDKALIKALDDGYAMYATNESVFIEQAQNTYALNRDNSELNTVLREYQQQQLTPQMRQTRAAMPDSNAFDDSASRKLITQNPQVGHGLLLINNFNKTLGVECDSAATASLFRNFLNPSAAFLQFVPNQERVVRAKDRVDQSEKTLRTQLAGLQENPEVGKHIAMANDLNAAGGHLAKAFGQPKPQFSNTSQNFEEWAEKILGDPNVRNFISPSVKLPRAFEPSAIPQPR